MAVIYAADRHLPTASMQLSGLSHAIEMVSITLVRLGVI